MRHEEEKGKDKLVNIKEYFKETKIDIDKSLVENLPTGKDILSKAIHYVVFSTGKRLRPIIVIATAEMLGAKREDAILPACAIELIHNFTLIHDDLPCIDDDDFRRGKPTLHRKYNEAIAVLTGDALLNSAFGVLAKADGLLSPSIKIKLIEEVSRAIGINGLVGGQVKEMSLRPQKLTLPIIEDIYLRKTASLIAVAVRMGAIIRNVTKKELALLTDYGVNIGIAFQLTDDILEFINGQTRKKKDEPNYVLSSSIEKTREVAQMKIKLAKENLCYFGRKSEILSKIADYIIERDY